MKDSNGEIRYNIESNAHESTIAISFTHAPPLAPQKGERENIKYYYIDMEQGEIFLRLPMSGIT